MTTSGRAYRVLLRAYPPSLRRAHGEEMVQLVDDRRSLGGEAWWRLWPSLLVETLRLAPGARWEALLTGHRSLMIGALGAVGMLAVLSDGIPEALPIVAVVVLAGVGVVRWGAPEVIAKPARPWRRWLAIGGWLLLIVVVVMASVDRELSPLAWSGVMATLVVGLFAVTTGLFLLATQHRPAVAS